MIEAAILIKQAIILFFYLVTEIIKGILQDTIQTNLELPDLSLNKPKSSYTLMNVMNEKVILQHDAALMT